MVLVAAIALASSTYAWFVSNNTVDATVSSISAQSNAAYLTIDNVNTMANAGTQTAVTLTENPTKLYPSRPKETVSQDGNNSTLSWTAATVPANLAWQTAYAADAAKSDVQTDADGKAIYYDLTHTNNYVTGTKGYVVTSQVYVSSSQGAFNSLKIDSMGVTGTATGENAKNDIVNAVGAVISCGDNWELWEYDATQNNNVGGWKQTAKSTNSLSGANTENFGDAISGNKVLTVNVTLFYDGDYTTINTKNFDNLGQAKVSLGFSATPVQQGVSGNYQQNYDPNASKGN